MIFIGRKNIKIFKLFLVSPILEKILLLTFIIFLPLIAFYPENFYTYTNFDLAVSLINSFNTQNFNLINTKTDFYIWVRNYVIPTYYTSKITPNLPLRSIRFRQYRYPCNPEDLSASCLNSIKNMVENTNSFQGNNLNTSSCIFESCNEFQYRFDKSNCDTVKGVFGNYPMYGYRVELGLDESSALQNLNKLEENGWVDEKTVALLLEANYYNYWKNKYVIFRALLEFQGETVIEQTFTYSFISDYGNDNIILFIYLIFVIQMILLLLKILFEITMIFNKILFFGQMAHLANQFAFLILFAIKLTYLNEDTLESRATSSKPFIYLYKTALIENYCKMMIFAIFLFYPFKIFQFISWSKYMSFMVKFWVSIYRTLPGVSLYFLMIAILVLNWSLGFMIIFQDFLIQFKDFASCILSLFSINFGSIDFLELQILTGTFNEIFYFIYFIQSFSFILIIVYFFAILSDLFQRSAVLEFNQSSPTEKETQERLEEMQFKFDRFIKELKKEFEKDKKDSEDNLFSHPQNKILIWLDCSQGLFTVYEDVMIELKGFKVQTRRFIHTEEVIQFLDYLFKLKPNLLSFRAGERFRIVAENYQNFNNGSDSKSVDTLIDWLKHVGCRVPILIYSDSKLERDVQIYLKKKYPSILFVYEMVNLIRYCRMSDSIYAFYESLNKQENKEKVEDGDSFTEEESYYE